MINIIARVARAVRRAIHVATYDPPRSGDRYKRCGDPTCTEAHP